MEPTTNNTSAKIIGALIIGLLVGFSAGVFWQERRSGIALPKEDTSAATTQTDATKDMTETGKVIGAPVRGLLVKDQSAGDFVEIANLDAQEIFWVAVREEKDGMLGNILGAQKVLVGNGQKVVVELLRPTVTGGKYRVVLYKDVGASAFNYREDVIIEGVEGKFTAK